MALRSFLPFFGRDQPATGTYADVLRKVPPRWRPLVEATLQRRAADCISIRTQPPRHVIDLTDPMGPRPGPHDEVIYQRGIADELPEATRGGVHSRMLALQEALADVGVEAHITGSRRDRFERPYGAIEGVIFGVEHLGSTNSEVLVTTNYVTGTGIMNPGDQAPPGWQEREAVTPRDYTNAQVQVPLSSSQTMYIRSGEVAGTHTAIIKALATSQVGLQTNARPLAVAKALEGVPSLITGAGASVLRGVRSNNAFRLSQVDVTVPDSHLDALAEALHRSSVQLVDHQGAHVTATGDALAEQLRATDLTLHGPGVGDLVVHVVSTQLFNDLLSQSTTHMVGNTRLTLGPLRADDHQHDPPLPRRAREPVARELGLELGRPLHGPHSP